MNATFPEIGAVQVFFTFIPEEVSHVLAYERRCVIAGGFETVDHGWRAGQQVLDASANRRYFGFGSFPLAYVAPRANHLDRLAILVSDELLLIVDPTIASVFLEKPIFHRVRAPLEQAIGFSLYRGEIIRVYAAAPKIRIFQVLVGFVAQA